MAGHLKHNHFTYKQCQVTTVANTTATILAGRHLTSELNTANGGVRIVVGGGEIDIGLAEWKRLQDSNLVSE